MLKATHSQSSLWWQWPLITRPVWFFMHAQPVTGTTRMIYAMGNPILWWAFLPSLGYVLVRFLRKRQAADGAILCGFFGQWLPWMFVGRVAFIQYLLPAVPFGALAVATVLEDLRLAWKGGRYVAIGYAAVCLAVFVNFYPFWSAGAVTQNQLQSRRWYWFETWRKT
jgi:dolichyl-phosphate-mannose--protein O-mannosyl transferase